MADESAEAPYFHDIPAEIRKMIRADVDEADCWRLVPRGTQCQQEDFLPQFFDPRHKKRKKVRNNPLAYCGVSVFTTKERAAAIADIFPDNYRNHVLASGHIISVKHGPLMYNTHGGEPDTGHLNWHQYKNVEISHIFSIVENNGLEAE